MAKGYDDNLFTRKEIIHFCMGTALPESDIVTFVSVFEDQTDEEFCESIFKAYQLNLQPLRAGKFYIRY
jgi:hypothetical protein